MVQYYMPEGMRYASLEERNQFYTSEFNLQGALKWFSSQIGNVKFAVIIGRHTKIYPEKYREDASTTIILDEYSTMEEVQQQILEFLPEAVYYDRNIYDSNGAKTGQELAFDLDPENITCPKHGSLAEKMKKGQGLSFCEIELQMVQQEAMMLFEFLAARFSNIKAVYSGRGFHLHVLDPHAYGLSAKERLKLAQEVKGEGFHIDEWVTSGEMRLIRLPYSLNGLVSRIALPLTKGELSSFNPIYDERALPKFLSKKATF
ncbi:MAG: DNA primase [Nitrososphaerales archaeon]